MAADMKQMIAEAARTLLMDKQVKKLTVKDIVEECHITRQSFYYHFEDIPNLLRWILEQGVERSMQEIRSQDGPEQALRYIFLMVIHIKPHICKSMQSNYGEELEGLIEQQFCRLFEQIVEEQDLCRDCTQFERKLLLRYHSMALLGILKDWTDEDNRHLDQIVHTVYRIMTGSITPEDGQTACG